MPVDVHVTVLANGTVEYRVTPRYYVRDLIIKAGLHHLSTADEGQQMDALFSPRMGDARYHDCVNS